MASTGFLKIGELLEVNSNNVHSTDSILAEMNDTEINERFKKFAQQLKRIAPKADDFLYFSCVMMTAAEAAALNPDGSPKMLKEGSPVEVKWEITPNGSWKWVSNDPSIKPYKNCFAPQTQVLMEDGTSKNIEDIIVGDMVITHTGEACKVLRTFETPHVGKLLNISVRNGRNILTTENHPFYRLTVNSDNSDNKPRKLLDTKSSSKNFEFIEANKLNKYDILLSPILNSRKNTEITEDMARLFGIFAAEGSYSKKYNKYQGLRFTFNIDEYDNLAKFTVDLLKKTFPNASVNFHKEKGNTCCVYATGYGLTDLFYKHVGEYSLHKTLSEDLLFAPDNIKKAFITGWLEGDGCVEKTNGQIIGITVSSNLASQIRCMLNSCGILHSLRKKDKEGQEIIINGNKSPVHDLYRIEIPFTFGKDIVKNSDYLKFENHGAERHQKHSYENYVIHTISDITEVDYTGSVYNLEVEKNNSYVANDVIVHNCNGDIFAEAELLKAYKKWVGKPLCVDHKSDQVDAIRGIILDTYYDRLNKRVIALCALDKVSYPELARGVSSGYKTCVSMGTRVGKAICYDCGQVATTEREFCQHMKTKSSYGEINVDLDPIELSIVVNGADPQAKIRTILAAANNLRHSIEEKEEELNKLSVSQDSMSKFQELEDDLKRISEKLSDLKANLEQDDDARAYGQAGDLAQFDIELSNTDQSINFPARLASNNNALRSELQDLKSSVNSKFKDMENTLATLSHKIKEEIMSVNSKDGMNKEGYFQGAGGANEPAPHQVKYPKEPLNEQLREGGDKHMTGVDNMGPVDGMFPGDKEKKDLVQRAELEERAMRRAAALQKAKENLMESKKAYFQGGGDVNEPTPGKPKYTKDPLNEKDREKEDKQMVGKKPFPGVGDVEELYPEDKKKKEMLQRASLKAKFVRVASEDGSQDLANSGWQVSRDGEVLFTATVDEISGGNVEGLYDVVASKEFGTKLLEKVYKVGAEKAASIYKGAQAVTGMDAVPAPAPSAPAPDAGAAPMQAMPEMAPPAPETEPVADTGAEGDPKEVAMNLATEMRDRASDLLEAVRVLVGEQSEMGELEGLTQKAASKELGSLVKMKKTLNASLVSGMKKAIAELNEHREELNLISDILEDGSVSTDYTNTIVEEAIVDAKGALADVRNLMQAFVKYARGSEQLAKQAQMVEEHSMADDNDMDLGPSLDLDEPSDEELFESDHVSDDEPLFDDEPELSDEPSLEDEDVNEVMMDVDPASLQGKKVEIKSAGLDLSTKEARAELRAKLAAEALKFSPVLDDANSLADGQTALDVKPSGDLGKVETLEEQHKKTLEVAEAPPKVRKEAARLNDLIKAGKVSESDLDTLIAEGLDAEVVKYWKQFFGQAGKEGSEFATELLKEHAKAQVEEEVNKYKVKISRAYELTNEMVRRGLVADERSAITAQVEDMMSWNDEGFEAMKRVVNKHPLRKAASFPQVGVIGSGEPVSQVSQEISLQDALDQAFGNRRY